VPASGRPQVQAMTSAPATAPLAVASAVPRPVAASPGALAPLAPARPARSAVLPMVAVLALLALALAAFLLGR
jgi:hypothetical protein